MTCPPPRWSAVSRRARLLAVGAGIAIASILSTPTLAFAAPSSSTTSKDTGLFGTGDPTYDGVFRQSLALLAFAAQGVTPPSAAIKWLVTQQCPDGGWQAYRADTAAACTPPDPANFVGEDTNSTAVATMAVQALHVTPPHSPLAFLASGQTSDGGFAYYPGGTSDPNSTGLVVAALVAEHQLRTAPAWTKSGHTALDYLLGLQIGCAGSIANRGGIPSPYSSGTPDLFAMLQGLPGLGQFAYPVATDVAIANDDPTLACPSQSAQPPAATSDAAAGYAAGWLARQLVSDGTTKYAPGFTPAPSVSNTAYAVLALTGARHEKSARDAALAWLLAHLPSSSDDAKSPAQLALVCLAVHAGTTASPTGLDCTNRLNRAMHGFVLTTASPSASATASSSVGASPAVTPPASVLGSGQMLPMTGLSGPAVGALSGLALGLIFAGFTALGLAGRSGTRRVVAPSQPGSHRSRLTRS